MGTQTDLDFNRNLANYFASKALYLDEPTQKKPNTRKLVEQPWQQTKAEMWDELTFVLCNFDFIKAKCVGLNVFDLQKDYDHAIHLSKSTERNIPSIHLLKLSDFYRFVAFFQTQLAIHSGYPNFVMQTAYNYSVNSTVRIEAEKVLCDSKSPTILRVFPDQTDNNNQPELIRILYPSSKSKSINSNQGYNDFEESVTKVAMTIDSTIAISGGKNGTLCVWDLISGEFKYYLKGALSEITSIAIAYNGLFTISAHADLTCWVWDLTLGRIIYSLNMNAKITSVKITKNGQTAVMSSTDGIITIWDLIIRKTKNIIITGASPVNDLDITPDGAIAIIACGKDVQSWDMLSGKCIHHMNGHKGIVTSVSIDATGYLAISGSEDKSIRIWDLQTGEPLHICNQHSFTVSSVAMALDGQLALSASSQLRGWPFLLGRAILLWDVHTGVCLGELRGHTSGVNCVIFGTEGTTALSGGKDKTVRLWDLSSKLINKNFGPSLESFNNGNQYYTEIMKSYEGGSAQADRVTCINMSAGSDLVVSGNEIDDIRVYLWSAKKGNIIRTWSGHTRGVGCVALTPDGLGVISGSSDNFVPYTYHDRSLVFYNTLKDETKFLIPGHKKGFKVVDIQIDGSVAISGSKDYTIGVWDLITLENKHFLCGHTNTISCVAISPDGFLCISGSDDHTVRIWNLITGECIDIFSQHSDKIISVAISPDGLFAVSASGDKEVRYWDLRSRESILVLNTLNDIVPQISFSPDGQYIIIATNDSKVRTVNLISGEWIGLCIIEPFLSVLSNLSAGCMFASGSETGQINTYRLHEHKSKVFQTTVVNLHKLDNNVVKEYWDTVYTAICSNCGKRVSPTLKVLKTITKIINCMSLYPKQAPSLHLPKEAWDDPGLIDYCPLCKEKLKFNPFITANIEVNE